MSLDDVIDNIMGGPDEPDADDVDDARDEANAPDPANDDAKAADQPDPTKPEGEDAGDDAKTEDAEKSKADAGEQADKKPEGEVEGDDDADRPKMVPLSALHEQREKNRALREERDQLRQKLESRGSGPSPSTEAKPLSQDEQSELQRLEKDDEDSDYMAKADRRRLADLRQRQRQATAAQQAEEAKSRATVDRVKRSIANAREEMTAAVQGQGLDFDTVHREGYQNLSEADKLALLEAGDDAGAKLYELAIARTPALRERLAARKATTKAKPAHDDPNEPATSAARDRNPKPKPTGRDQDGAAAKGHDDAGDDEEAPDLDAVQADPDAIVSMLYPE